MVKLDYDIVKLHEQLSSLEIYKQHPSAMDLIFQFVTRKSRKARAMKGIIELPEGSYILWSVDKETTKISHTIIKKDLETNSSDFLNFLKEDA